VYSFGNLLSFGLGYEKSIVGISGATKYHVFARCIDLFVFRHSGKSAGSITSLLMGLIDFGTKNLKKSEKSSGQFF